MKFESRKAPLFMFVIYSIVSFSSAIVLIGILKSNITVAESIPYLVLLAVSGFILWFFHTTNYEIKGSDLLYKSGPLKGKIQIESITEIKSGDTNWAEILGLKPATAMYGLTIKYDASKEIYISPEVNDLLIEKIIEINPDVKIVKG